MKKVVIKPGCISCGRCEFIAPEVFQVTDVARVNQQVDVEKFGSEILQAISACPVQVIALLQADKQAEK